MKNKQYIALLAKTEKELIEKEMNFIDSDKINKWKRVSNIFVLKKKDLIKEMYNVINYFAVNLETYD